MRRAAEPLSSDHGIGQSHPPVHTGIIEGEDASVGVHRGPAVQAKVANAMTILDPVAETRERLAVATLR